MGLDRFRLLPASALVALALGCGGNVVVDGAASQSAGSSSATSPDSASVGAGAAGPGSGNTGVSGTGVSGTGVGGTGVGGSAASSGGGGATSTSTASASSSTATSSSSGAGGGTTHALWDILGLPSTPHGAGFNGEVNPVIAVDADGNTYLASSYWSSAGGTISFSAPLPCSAVNDLLVAKVSPAGQLVWSECFTQTPLGDQPANAWLSVDGIAVSPAGQVALIGSFNGTLDYGSGTLQTASDVDEQTYLTALDASTGSVVWARQFVTPENQGQLGWGLAADADGNLYFGGYLRATLDLGTVSLEPNKLSVFVAKVDPSGAGVWITEVGHAQQAEPPLAPVTVAVSPDGSRCAISTSFQGTADFAPGTTLESEATLLVSLDAPTGIVEWGFYPAPEGGSVAAFGGDDDLVVVAAGPSIAKLDQAGGVVWQKTLVGLGQAPPHPALGVASVAADASGNVLYAAFTNRQEVGLDASAFSCPQDLANQWCLFVGNIDSNGVVGSAEGLPMFRYFSSAVAFGAGEHLVAGQFWRWIDFGSGPTPDPITPSAIFLAALP